MKVVIYNKITQELLKQWQELWEKSSFANYSNAPHWFLSVVDVFCLTNYVVIAVYENDKLIAIGGLVKEKKYGLHFYTNMPSDFVCGVPFLIDSTDITTVNEFVNQLLQLGNIFLSNVPEEFMNLVKQYTSQMDAIVQSSNYFLPLQKDKNGLAVLNKRIKLVKQIKEYKEKIEFRSYDGKTKEGLEIAFMLDEQSSKHGKGYNTFNTSLMKKFYKCLSQNFGKHFLVNILYFENKPIAYEIGFFVNRTYFGSQMAYDIEYRQYSPGKVILAYTADFLASKSAKMWDLGSGESPVKKLVTEEKRQLYQVIISSNKNVRSYFSMVGKLKMYGFEQSKRYVKLYAFYRKIRNFLSKQKNV